MQQFETHDLGLAAYLLTQGIELAGTQADTEKRTTFFFQNSAELTHLYHQYWSNQALVNPIEYSFKIRFLKKLIFQAQR